MLAQNIRNSLVHGAFHDDVEVLLVIEGSVNLDDVRMVEETLSLNLPDELLDHVFFLEFLLR